MIAFVVSDYAFAISKNQTALPIRVYAQPAEVGNSDLALEDGQRILSAFEKYLKVPYSLPKLDQIAIPDMPGAMENWGKFVRRCEVL